MAISQAKGQTTKYPGVSRLSTRTYRIRARRTDPRTGRRKEKDRILENVSLQEAVREQQQLVEALDDEIQGRNPPNVDQKVGEFARSWIESKAAHLDPGTLERYADALELHILPELGDFEYRALTRFDVQKWADQCLRATYTTPSGKRKRYSVASVKGWFRVLRTMTQDAIDPLGIERDPTMRIRFAEEPESGKSCAVTAEQLTRFLRLMQENYPQHYALVVVLAFTGMRWCHASALKWEDWREGTGVLTIRRKHSRNRVGPVTRKKRAPKELPTLPDVTAVLRWHREWMRVHRNPSEWMFPSRVGTLRAPSSVSKAWNRCRELAGISGEFTPHGLRYTFTDLTRLIEADPVARRAITGHVTETMQRKYSTVRLHEKRSIMGGVHDLVPLESTLPVRGGINGGTEGGLP